MATCVIDDFRIGGVRITIDKKNAKASPNSLEADTLPFYTVVDCSLTRELLKPNEFTFTLRRNSLTKNDKLKEYPIIEKIIGQTVSCNVRTVLSGADISSTVFHGKIAKASTKGTTVTCVAYSPDAELQGPPKCRCFTDMKLDAIVNTVIGRTANKKIKINTLLSDLVFPYIVQYNESDYDFLVRLAKRFGAFLYFHDSLKVTDQERIVFGNLEDDLKNITGSCFSISYELQLGDPNFRFVGHGYETDMDFDSGGYDYNTLTSKHMFKMAVDKSEKLENDSPFRIDNPNSLPKDPTEEVLNDYSLITMVSDSNQIGSCKFITYLFDVQVGNIVKIDNNGPMVVTGTTLTWDCNGSPVNEVTAMVLPCDTIDHESIFPPYLDYNAYPKSSAQRAVVVNNVDPLKMGRVQVQFVWQISPTAKEKENFPWIRIAQPYGGKEKGCYIIPEIGEEVMVGFEHNNMEKPFVIGTLYHGAKKNDDKQLPEDTWCEVNDKDHPNNNVNVGNEVKAFRTKKGHTIEFHDVDGDDKYGFIRIYNKNKGKSTSECYEIVLSSEQIQVPNADNSGKVDYQIKSAKDEDIEAGKDIAEKDEYKADKLRLLVRSNGGDIVLDAGTGDIIMNAKNIRVHASGDATTLIDQKNIMKVKGDQFVDVNNNSLVVQGDQTVLVKGKDTEEYKKTVSINTGTTTEGGDEGVFILDAKKPIHIHTEKELTVYSEQTIEVNSDAEVKLGANSMNTSINNKAIFKASDIDATATKGAAKITSQTGLTLDGGTQADLKAKTVTVDGEVSATLKGGKLDIQGTQSISATSGKITFTSTTGSLEGAWKWP